VRWWRPTTWRRRRLGRLARRRERRRGDGCRRQHGGRRLPPHEQHRGRQFWLIAEPGGDPVAIMACGRRSEGDGRVLSRHASIPPRGPLAANTVAGAVSVGARPWRSAADGWESAAAPDPGGRHRLRPDGTPVTVSQHTNTAAKLPDLKDVPGYATQFLVNGEPPAVGSLFRQPKLAATLERLAAAGLDDFYRGEIGAANAANCRGWEAR